MTWYYTLSIDEEGLKAAIDDLTERVNSFSKRRKPFRIVVQEEQLDPGMATMVIRFYLVITPDFVVKNERQAWALCRSMKEAAEEVEAMNNANYVLAPPPRKNGPRH